MTALETAIATAQIHHPNDGDLAVVPLRMDEARKIARIVDAATDLLSRGDFWVSVQEAGWILPAEIDGLREALESYNTKLTGA